MTSRVFSLILVLWIFNSCSKKDAAPVKSLQLKWAQSSLSYHGQITSIAVSGSNIFAGTFGGGVFLSTNNGTSWSEVNNGLTNQQVTALTISGNDIFAGTNGGGVFLSSKRFPAPAGNKNIARSHSL